MNIKGMLKNNFAKNVMMLVSGTAFAQVISVLLSPIITRIYSPEEFSTLTIFISILGVVSLLGSLTYDSAIPIAEDNVKAINILSLSLIILTVFSFSLTVVLFFWGEYFLLIINANELIIYKYFIVIGLFMSGIYTIFNSWALRIRNYKVIAKTKYSQSIIGNAGKITFGLMGFGPGGLIIGQILGQSTGIVNLCIPIIKEHKELLKNIDIKTIIWCVKRYIKFPKYSAPTLLIISLASQLPIFFLSIFYTPDTVGYYGLALTMTFLPMGLIGKSVQDVFYGESAKLGKSNPKEIKRLSNNLLKKLLVIGAVPTIFLIFLGPELFNVVFGDKWYGAGIFASVLAIYAYAHFIFHPVSVVFSVFEVLHLQFYLNIIKIVLVIIVFYTANTFSLSAILAILLFSITMGAAELAKYLLAQYVINKHISKN